MGCLAQGRASGFPDLLCPHSALGPWTSPANPPGLPFLHYIDLLLIAPLLCEVLSSYLWNCLFNLPYLAGSPMRDNLGGPHRACTLNLMTEMMKYFADKALLTPMLLMAVRKWVSKNKT